MDPKELRNSSLTVNVNDDTSKYPHNSSTLPEGKNKSYNDIGSSSIGKVDASTIRPCAIIGPDRVVSHATDDFHLKKSSVESWTYPENVYRQPPDYPTKPNDYHPTRNISPRQTFQENMQRIMVSPIYSSVKNSDESNLKNSKLNMPQEAKYCDVPYNINTVNNDHKSVRNSDIPMSSVNPSFSRSGPPYSWPTPVNVRPSKPYGAPEYYQYSEYANCGPRPMMMTRPLRSHHEETTQAYPERLYQDANIRFKPYPPPKDKHQHMRYDYINNYQNTFHPPVPIPPHKFDLQKPLHGHPYPIYPQLKYLDRRIHDPYTDGYQRPNQNNLNAPFRNQILPPPYGPLSGNCVQNKPFTDMASKPMTVNKHLTFDSNNKIYLDLEPTRKAYPTPENIYYNDMNHIRGEMVLPNHTTLNMHSMPQHQMYRRDNPHIKPYEYNIHYRNVDQSMNLNYSLQRLPLQFSPNAIAISPSDSTTSIDTIHTMNMSQEDCGYVSQSSTTSVRSLDSGHVPPNEFYRRRENHGTLKKSSHANGHMSQNQKNKINSSNKKNLDVRQFLQMWNEGEDEINEPTKDVSQIQVNNLSVPSEQVNNQEQLYVLGLVNVPSEELSKYDHIQKISKLPENIKGYNSIEILNQYEKFVESSNTNKHFTHKHLVPKEHHYMSKRFDKENSKLPRPVSPLDVEAKISQSVIHKEVGCNFEIKPCSPEMLNVEIATPVQNILGERIIEKVTNSTLCKSPMLSTSNGNKTQISLNNHTKIANCNMINNQYSLNNYPNLIKPNNYNAQDFNTSTGISLASLPRLDNDIELNFPEINQQFMTANKIETEIVVPAKDLPRLDIEEVNSINDNNIFQQNILSSPITFCQNIEKESTKLSKYRKNKKCEVITKEENFNEHKELIDPVHQRIDSVIIKNPDNIKLHENLNETPVANAGEVNINNRQCEVEESRNQTETENDVCNLSFETAIDFSLNKSDEGNDAPCQQMIDTIEKSKKLDSTCVEAFGQDDTNNKPNDLDNKQKETVFNFIGKESLHRNSLECPFRVNEYLQTKSFEESNVPVIKELSCESGSSKAVNTIGKENDTSVIQENKITPLKNDGKDFLQEQINTEKEIEYNNDLLSSEPYVSNISQIINSDNVENLKLELNTIVEKKIETDDKIAINTQLCKYISLQEEHFSNNDINPTRSNELENSILEGVNLSYVKVVNEINSKESTITNKFAHDIDEAHETEKDISLSDGFKLNQRPRKDGNIINISKSDVEIIEKRNEIEDIVNSQDSNTTFNNIQIKLDIVPNNNINVIDSISYKEEEDTSQIQSAVVAIGNESNLENDENTADNCRIGNESNLENDENTADNCSIGNESNLENDENTADNCRIGNESNLENDENTADNCSIGNESNLENDENTADNCSIGNESNLENDENTAHNCRIGNESNLENNENIGSCDTVRDTPQSDKYMFITQDFLAKEISNEEILNNTNFTTDGTKGNKIETKNIKEEINYDPDDSDINISSCSQHSEENPESLDVTCCNVESSSSLILSVVTNKITPTLRIYKELFSPWMQKLHLFNEGYCKNVPYVPKELPKEGNLRPAISMENDAEYVSCQSSEDINILPSCDNISGKQEFITINSTESKNDSFTVQLSDHFEDTEKDNSINLLCNNSPSVFQRNTLKRCLSESALYDYKDDEELKSKPNKRKKGIDNFLKPHIISEDICNIIQNNRRNSVSTFYNDNSLYIVIDNDLIIEAEEAEDNEAEECDKIYISKMSEDLNITNGETIESTGVTITNELDSNEQIECIFSETIYSEEKTFEETWIEDVACIETVISEEVIEDSELNGESRKEDDNEIINGAPLLHFGTDSVSKIKNINGTTVSHLVTCNEAIHRTSHLDVDKTLLFNESLNNGEDRSPNQLNNDVETHCISTELNLNVPSYDSSEIMDEKENIAENVELGGVYVSRNIYSDTDENQKYSTFLDEENEGAKNYTTLSCQSPDENSLIDMKKGNSPSSPEVSSTTSEEKNSNILLKITNYNGSRMSQINEVTTGNLNKLSYKLTEKKEYRNYNSNFRSSRTLITKAAQKYIPPLKNTIRDLKVKLPLPEHRLNSLKQLKTSKIVPKIDDIVIKINEKNHKQSMPKKQKPKFEDVLKSIEEIQFKRHKNNVKKGKNVIPKVIIKKNENGAHYASTNTLSNTEAYNPDLTGRKWQPWVFLEKNNFIDKMAVKNKIRAVYCHRKKTFVIAEKFKKYKSIYNANFVISQPNSSSCSKGNLKYTIRLKHN